MSKADTALLRANRIFVALDTSARGQAALAAALCLARDAGAELQGLFVEDEDLVRLAALPFAREVDLTSASPRPLHLANMERDLQASGREARQAFATALRELNLQWTFRIVRGTLMQASLAEAGEVDLVVIGQRGRSSRILANVYLQERIDTDRRVVTVFDGSPSALRALELGSRLVQSNASVLSVLVLAKERTEVARRCTSWLQRHEVRAEVDQVVKPSKEAVMDFVKKRPPELLVINRDSQFVDNSQIRRLADELDCPLILC